MARVKVTARVYGPRLMARSKVFPAEAHRLLDDTLQDVADVSQDLFVTAAPEKTGRLKRGIETTRTGSGISLRITAVDPKTGFDYVGVTRFGHKVRRIRPIEGRTPSGKRRFRSGFLRFEYGGTVFFKRSVRGYKPKVDWVVAPRVETSNYARQAFRTFESEIARRW
jgi:hypothetical protein